VGVTYYTKFNTYHNISQVHHIKAKMRYNPLRMTSHELRKKYIEFFKNKGHKEIPSAPLVPENDPTVLFTTAGMHPLVPFLLGEPHPSGKRLVNFQKCVRTGDIDEVGDAFHHTFFEMLGNWSLGDYFKKEAISFSYEFLTKELGLDVNRLHVTCFAGDKDVPKDTESAEIWESLGIPRERIYFLGKKENFWGPVGESGPCGPDTEMHYDITQKPCGPNCNPSDNCGRFSEIWNDVFMEYNKTKDGKYEPLKQKNVDTGMGLERALAVVNNQDDNYQADLFLPIIQKIEEISGKKYDEYKRDFRVIADHIKATAFIISDHVIPSNQGHGYILRRLIRRAARKGKALKINHMFTHMLIDTVINIYSQQYPKLKEQSSLIKDVVAKEEEKFQIPLDGIEHFRIDLEAAKEHGLNKKIKDISMISSPGVVSGAYVYEMFQTYGVPSDLSIEVIKELGLQFNQAEYDEAFKKHQELSRTASAGMFKGGLADHSEEVTKYHTATHLLHASLRQILGDHVQQKGSNLTAERLRFDFSQPEKLSEDQIKQVEDLVNEKIKENLAVTSEVMDKEAALKSGALAFFGDKYGDKVTVYSVGNFSREICGGPHVKSTEELGNFKIIKEESAGAGIRRIYAVLNAS